MDPDPAVIRRRVERLMAEHAAIKPRGFDSNRRRADIRRQIDVALDDWLLLTTAVA